MCADDAAGWNDATEQVAQEHDAAVRETLAQLRIRIECAATELQDAAAELLRLGGHLDLGGPEEEDAVAQCERCVSYAARNLLAHVEALEEDFGVDGD